MVRGREWLFLYLYLLQKLFLRPFSTFQISCSQRLRINKITIISKRQPTFKVIQKQTRILPVPIQNIRLVLASSFILCMLIFHHLYWSLYIKRTLIYEWVIIIDRKNRLEMGQTLSVEANSAYLSSLTFIQATNDQNFCHIDIYRTKQPPYEYVMDFKKNFIEDNERMGKYVRLVQQLKNMEHKNLAKIHHSQLIEENQMCIKHKKIHTFCNYYNFTLEAAVEKKKLQDAFFPETELVYIMGALLQAAGYLQKYGISVGQYKTKSIYLSPQGYVKLYLLEVQQENRHSCYFKVAAQRSQIENYILAPQQLYYINQLEYDIKYDVYKADVFAIAMVILQLITLDKSKFYYNEAKSELKIDRISFDISSMGKNYSEAFINLLKHCLQPIPALRCSIQQATDELSYIRRSMKTITYCIRLQQDDEKAKKSTYKREISMSVKGQHILNGLQKKLTPTPITTLSSSTSSNFKVDSKTNSSRASQVGSIKL